MLAIYAQVRTHWRTEWSAPIRWQRCNWSWTSYPQLWPVPYYAPPLCQSMLSATVHSFLQPLTSTPRNDSVDRLRSFSVPATHREHPQRDQSAHRSLVCWSWWTWSRWSWSSSVTVTAHYPLPYRRNGAVLPCREWTCSAGGYCTGSAASRTAWSWTPAAQSALDLATWTRSAASSHILVFSCCVQRPRAFGCVQARPSIGIIQVVPPIGWSLRGAVSSCYCTRQASAWFGCVLLNELTVSCSSRSDEGKCYRPWVTECLNSSPVCCKASRPGLKVVPWRWSVCLAKCTGVSNTLSLNVQALDFSSSVLAPTVILPALEHSPPLWAWFGW